MESLFDDQPLPTDHMRIWDFGVSVAQLSHDQPRFTGLVGTRLIGTACASIIPITLDSCGAIPYIMHSIKAPLSSVMIACGDCKAHFRHRKRFVMASFVKSNASPDSLGMDNSSQARKSSSGLSSPFHTYMISVNHQD
jgi:hypothetical protein